MILCLVVFLFFMCSYYHGAVKIATLFFIFFRVLPCFASRDGVRQLYDNAYPLPFLEKKPAAQPGSGRVGATSISPNKIPTLFRNLAALNGFK